VLPLPEVDDAMSCLSSCGIRLPLFDAFTPSMRQVDKM
jgi:hypothetical protein